jgi:hypothetical protein
MSATSESNRYWLIIGFVPNCLGAEEKIYRTFGPCGLSHAMGMYIDDLQGGFDDLSVLVTGHFSSASPIQ